MPTLIEPNAETCKQGSMSGITPTHPGTKAVISEEAEKIIRERLATYDQDKKRSKPWPEVKARILEQLKLR